MSDGSGAPGVIAGVVQEVAPVAQEIKQDAQDAVGQAIEAGVQSVMGTQLTPQQIQQKEEDRQKKIAEVRWQIQQINKTETEIEKVRKEKEQKEKQRLEAQVQEQQMKKMEMEQKKKQPINPVVAYAGKVEFKRGVGG